MTRKLGEIYGCDNCHGDYFLTHPRQRACSESCSKEIRRKSQLLYMERFREKNRKKFLEAMRAYGAARRRENPEKVKAIQHLSYLKNKEKIMAKLRIYRSNNLEKVRKWSRDGTRRRRLKLKLEGKSEKN